MTQLVVTLQEWYGQLRDRVFLRQCRPGKLESFSPVIGEVGNFSGTLSENFPDLRARSAFKRLVGFRSVSSIPIPVNRTEFELKEFNPSIVIVGDKKGLDEPGPQATFKYRQETKAGKVVKGKVALWMPIHQRAPSTSSSSGFGRLRDTLRLQEGDVYGRAACFNVRRAAGRRQAIQSVSIITHLGTITG